MASFSKLVLSGSTNGKGILIAQTATIGDTVHTAHATSLDEVYLYAHNAHTAAVELTIEFGGATDPGEVFVYSVPNDNGLHLVCPGLILTNSLLVNVFAGTTNVITVFGYVNRIT